MIYTLNLDGVVREIIQETLQGQQPHPRERKIISDRAEDIAFEIADGARGGHEVTATQLHQLVKDEYYALYRH